MRCGLSASAIRQTGQSAAIHSPEACASTVVRLTVPIEASIAVVCTVAICWAPRAFRTISKPLAKGASRKLRAPSPGLPEPIIATSDFSGLVSAHCALASADASEAIDSLDRCMGALPRTALNRNDIETDRAGLRAPGPDTVAACLFGIVGHQRFEFGLGAFVLGMG